MLYCCSYCKRDIETCFGDEIHECEDQVCKSIGKVFCSIECKDNHILYKCDVLKLSLVQKMKLFLFKKMIKMKG